MKENVNFWDEDIYTSKEGYDQFFALFQAEIETYSTEIHESTLSSVSMEVSYTISGYTAKKIGERLKCEICTDTLTSDTSDEPESEFLEIASRCGLTIPTKTLSAITAHIFCTLDIVESVVHKHDVIPAKYVLEKLVAVHGISCENHRDM